MVAELELQHYQVKVGYLGFMNQYFICVQLIDDSSILSHKNPRNAYFGRPDFSNCSLCEQGVLFTFEHFYEPTLRITFLSIFLLKNGGPGVGEGAQNVGKSTVESGLMSSKNR